MIHVDSVDIRYERHASFSSSFLKALPSCEAEGLSHSLSKLRLYSQIINNDLPDPKLYLFNEQFQRSLGKG